ncbi:hypothetical protein QN363_20160, partial [Undibacterium sp. CCC2.1]
GQQDSQCPTDVPQLKNHILGNDQATWFYARYKRYKKRPAIFYENKVQNPPPNTSDKIGGRTHFSYGDTFLALVSNAAVPRTEISDIEIPH